MTSLALSRDGTQIAFEKSGQGPALILIDGALCSRALGPMGGLIPLLAGSFTVFAYDRRGRNESGNTLPYSPLREIEDIEALIQHAGGSAHVFGMSSGAALALQAAMHGLKIQKVALYEPPFGVDGSNRGRMFEHLMKIKQLLAENRQGDAVRYFQVDVVGIPRVIPFILRLTPMWKKLISTAPTLAYDLELLGDGMIPAETLAGIDLSAGIFCGEKSPKFLKDGSHATSEAMKQGELILLPGQNHNFSAKALAPQLEKFLLK